MNIGNWLLAHFTGIAGTPPCQSTFHLEISRIQTCIDQVWPGSGSWTWEMTELVGVGVVTTGIQIHFNSSHLQNSRAEWWGAWEGRGQSSLLIISTIYRYWDGESSSAGKDIRDPSINMMRIAWDILVYQKQTWSNHYWQAGETKTKAKNLVLFRSVTVVAVPNRTHRPPIRA